MRYEITNFEFLKLQLAELSDDLSLPWNAYPCLEWPRGIGLDGYGKVRTNGATSRAHRVAFGLTFGPISDGLFVCHHCDNRRCFRPSHLFSGTALENQRDRIRKGRGQEGEQHSQAKLTEEQVRQIRSDYANGARVPSIALKFGISKSWARVVAKSYSWQHIEAAAAS